MLKNIKSFDEYKPFIPWLKRITIHTCLNFKRDRKPVVSLDQIITDRGDTLKDALAGQFNLEKFVMFKETSRTIRNCIRSLDDIYRMPLILRHEHNMSYDEIAKLLDLPLGTLKVNLYRGRKNYKND